jgi:exopolysaccharide biosynthesis polyprenyl glycosylphosphotransferase
VARVSGSWAKRSSAADTRRVHWRPTPAKGARLPQYDVRLTRELANRRMAISVVRQGLRLVTLHALDAAAIMVAAVIADAALDPGDFGRFLPWLVAFLLIGLNLRGSYRAGDSRRDLPRLVTGAMIGVIVASPLLIQSGNAQAREFLVLFAVTAIAALFLERRVVDAVVHAAYAHGIGLRRALVIARKHEYLEVLAGIAPHQIGRSADDQVIVGYLTPEVTKDANAMGSLLDLEAVLTAHDVSELIVASALVPDILTDIAEACFERGVRPIVLAPTMSSPDVWAELTRVGRLAAYQLHPLRLELPALVVKRVTDVAVAGVGLVIGMPLMLLIALAIKIESRGPVFFRQRRVGLGGRQFMMWKFRSMAHEAESKLADVAHLNRYPDGRLFKLQTDPRVTRVGRLLRRFSLDELPQLVNIMVGDMSVVGPRPPLPSEVQSYEPRHYVRLSVVPGLTGPWQVSGRNLITDFEEVVRLEREYIEAWSLRWDVEIILRTFFVVLSGRGAY